MQVTYDEQVGASAVVRNALADTDLAIVPTMGFLNIYGRHEVTSTGLVRLTLHQGETLEVESAPMTANDALAPNRVEDKIAGPIPCIGGKSLRARLEETTGAATDLNVVFDFVPADPMVVIAALAGS